MLEIFKEIIETEFDVVDIELNSNFKYDFGLTSDDLFTLLCVIEEYFGVLIEEERYSSLNTIEDLIEYIEIEYAKQSDTNTKGISFGK
jgi:acyl carrier protein